MEIFILLVCQIFVFLIKLCMIAFIIISIPLIIYLYSFTSRAAKQLIHLQMVKLEYKRYIKDRKRYINEQQQKEQER
nr:MAG TPA: hypothetical protein [Caudoviricetes sp.]